MAGIRKLMIVDSTSCTGRIVSLDVTDHVAFLGRNGAGKTSTIELFAIPFGLHYRKLNKAKSFAEFYLPRQSSALAYEYVNHDGEICFFYIFRGEEHPAFRFAKGELRSEFFYDEDAKKLLDSDAVTRKISAAGFSVSPQIPTVNEFRSVMLGVMTDRENTRKHAHHNAKFGMCLHNRKVSDVADLGDLLFAMLQKAGAYQNMRSAILSHVVGETDTTPNLTQSIAGIRNIVHDVIALDAVLKSDALFVEAGDVVQRFKERDARLSRILTSVKAIALSSKEDAAIQMAEFSRTSSDLSASVSEARKSRTGIVNQMSRAQDALEATRSTLGHKSREYESRLQEDVRPLQRAVAEIGGARSRKDGLRMEAEAIESKSVSIERIYAEQIENAHRSLATSRENLESLSGQQRQDIASRRPHVEERVALRRSEINARFAQDEDRISALIGQARERLGETRSGSVPVPEDMMARKDAAHDACELAEKEKERSREKHSEAERALRLADDVARKSEAKVQAANLQIQRTRSDLKETQDALIAPEGSLLAYMRENKPDWPENVGLFIRREVLQAKVRPVMTGESEALIFGMRIDPKDLPPCSLPEANLQEMQENLEYVNATLLSDQSALADAEAELAKAHKARGKIVSDLDAARRDVTTHTGRYERAKSDRLLIETEIKTFQSRDQQRINEQIDIIRKEISDLETSMRSLRQARAAEIASLAAEHKDLMTGIDEAILQIERDLRGGLSSMREDSERNIAEMRSRCARHLSDEGVSLQNLENIRKSISEADAAISEGERARITLAERDFILKTARESIDVMQAKSEEQDRALADLTLTLEEKDAFLKELTEKLLMCEETHAATMSRISQRQAAAERIEERLFDMDPAETGDETFDPVDGQDALMLMMKERQEDSVRSNALSNALSRMFGQSRSESLVNANEEFLRKSRSAPAGVSAPMFILSEMSAWRRIDLSIFRMNTMTQLRVFKTKIERYVLSVDVFESDIAGFGRKLNKVLKEQEEFPFVREMSVSVLSTMKNSPSYFIAKRFLPFLTGWLEDTMPDEGMISALKKFGADLADLPAAETSLSRYVEISGSFIEGETRKSFRNEKEMAEISSSGLTLIFFISLYGAFISMMRGERDLKIPFSIDELATLDSSNKAILIRFAEQMNVNLSIACPENDTTMSCIGTSYIIENDTTRDMKVSRAAPVEEIY